MPVFQKLQAIHNYPVSSSQAALASSSNQIKIVTSQASTSDAAPGGGASVLQSSFPQGSILVVPHPTSPFHAVLPVFANTAVIMPPGAGGGHASSTTTPSSSATPSSEAATVVGVAAAQQGAGTAVLVSGATGGIAAPQQAITIDGRLLGIGGGGAGGGATGSSPDGTQMLQLVQQAMVSAGVTSAIVQPPLDTAAAVQGQEQDTTSSSLDKKHLTPEKLGGVASILQPTPIQLKDYQRLMALTAVAPPIPVYTMKVEEAVELVKVNFESKSIEMTGEVPITKIDTTTLTPDDCERLEASGGLRGVAKPGGMAGGKEGEKAAGEVSGKKEELEVAREEEVGGGKEVREAEKTSGDAEAKTEKGVERGGEGKINMVAESEERKKDGPGTIADSFYGHSSADLMSAELLLSLTGSGNKDWPAVSPTKTTPLKQPGPVRNDLATTTTSPSVVGVAHTSATSSSSGSGGGRKRKQKPIASAKPQTELEAAKEATPSSAKRRRVKKHVAEGAGSQSPQKERKEGGAKSIQFTPEELLEILNIPPSSSSSKSGGGAKGTKASVDSLSAISGSHASAKMEQLKASRAVKPMREYVIETDSEDSNSSSSSSSSSHFTPTSSDSSSDSSSNEDEDEEGSSEPPVKKSPGGVAKGRAKGRKLEQQGTAYHSSSSEESSSEEEEEGEGGGEEGKKSKAQQRGRGGAKRGGGGARRGGHVVSIPTRLLKTKIKRAKKLKSKQQVSNALCVRT